MGLEAKVWNFGKFGFSWRDPISIFQKIENFGFLGLEAKICKFQKINFFEYPIWGPTTKIKNCRFSLRDPYFEIRVSPRKSLQQKNHICQKYLANPFPLSAYHLPPYQILITTPPPPLISLSTPKNLQCAQKRETKRSGVAVCVSTPRRTLSPSRLVVWRPLATVHSLAVRRRNMWEGRQQAPICVSVCAPLQLWHFRLLGL